MITLRWLPMPNCVPPNLLEELCVYKLTRGGRYGPKTHVDFGHLSALVKKEFDSPRYLLAHHEFLLPVVHVVFFFCLDKFFFHKFNLNNHVMQYDASYHYASQCGPPMQPSPMTKDCPTRL